MKRRAWGLCLVLLAIATRADAVGTFITQFERAYGTAGTETGAEV